MDLYTLFAETPTPQVPAVAAAALRALDDILSGAELEVGHGICGNLDRIACRLLRETHSMPISHDLMGLTLVLAGDWPSRTGDWHFPVPHPDNADPAGAYLEEDLWTGEYGVRRLELARHVRDRLAKLIGISHWEITAYGFDGGTDETDDRIIWVTAESEAQVQDAIAGTDADYTPLTLLPPADAVDFHLPEDADALRGRLLQFQLET